MKKPALIIIILSLIIILLIVFIIQKGYTPIHPMSPFSDKDVEVNENTEEDIQFTTLYINSDIAVTLPLGWSYREDYYQSPGMQEQGMPAELVGYTFFITEEGPNGIHTIIMNGHQAPQCNEIPNALCDSITGLYSLSKDEISTQAFQEINDQLLPHLELQKTTNDAFLQESASLKEKFGFPENWGGGSYEFPEGRFPVVIAPFPNTDEMFVFKIPANVTLTTDQTKRCLGDSETQFCALGDSYELIKEWTRIDYFY